MTANFAQQQSPAPKTPTLTLAREVLALEANEIQALSARLGDDFIQAVNLLLNCQGRVVVTGMGKSGHVGGKIASTLASTGTPAFFMHPAEASHGDLGMITKGDVVIALSNSGESDEVLAILPSIKRLGAYIIAITGNARSTLAKSANVHLSAHVAKEACPLGLAPTSSTTVTLALGDALALCVLDLREFTAEDFARSHPGGSLGRRLIIRVQDLMRTGNDVPQISLSDSLSNGLLEMSRKGLGLTAVVENQQLAGVFTDGDLRRAFEKNMDINTTMQAVMRPNPLTIRPEQLAIDAVALMEAHKINALLVTDDNNQLVGALNMHDLLRAKVV